MLNANCNKSHTYKSFKLNKQSVRVTIICDKNKIPLTYSTNAARNHDSTLGFELANTLTIEDKNTHYLVGDKGYYMNDCKKSTLLKMNKLKLITPKRNYKKKKQYKTKNYNYKPKTIRHSKAMKNALKYRICVEHTNSVLHRSFKRFNKVYDKSMQTYNAFVELAIICMIIHKS